MIRCLSGALALTFLLVVPFGEFAEGRDSTKLRYPEAWAQVRHRTSDYPNLGRNFEVIDPTTGRKYNCIAHSLGVHSLWINPRTGPADQRLSYMDSMYRLKGYVRGSRLDYRLVPGVQKVVVYGQVSRSGITQVTHAAVQEADGTWTSKLGELPLIRHATPQAVNGPIYGEPIAVYLKRR